MSHDIFETDRIQVTAFAGKNGTLGIQIGLKGDSGYEQLDREQTIRLCLALQLFIHD